MRQSPLLAGLLAFGCADKEGTGDSGAPSTESDTDADTDSGVVVTFDSGTSPPLPTADTGTFDTGALDTGTLGPTDSGTTSTWSWYSTYCGR